MMEHHVYLVLGLELVLVLVDVDTAKIPSTLTGESSSSEFW